MSTAIHPFLPFWSYRPVGGDRVALTTRANVESLLISRASREPRFRERLLADPDAVIAKEFGVVLPEGTRLQVLSETDESVHMVLPRNPFAGMGEPELEDQYGLTLEEVARWVLRDRRGTLLDEPRSISLVTRAWRDDDFRDLFLVDPRGAIETTFGVKLPATRRFSAIQESSQLVCIVLPSLRSEPPEIDAAILLEANLGPQYVQILDPSSFNTLGPPHCPVS